MRKSAFIIALLLTSCAAIKTPAEPANDPTYGLQISNPIKTCSREGTDEYLSSLRCTNGSKPEVNLIDFNSRYPEYAPKTEDEAKAAWQEFRKLVIATKSGLPYTPKINIDHMVDVFEANCSGVSRTIYIDLYNCPSGKTRKIPKGFLVK